MNNFAGAPPLPRLLTQTATKRGGRRCRLVPQDGSDVSLSSVHAVCVETLGLVVGGAVIKMAFLARYYGRRDPGMAGGRHRWGLLFVIFKRFRW